MPLPEPATFSAILRVEDAPAWHGELTQTLGSPDTCFSDQRGSLWALEPSVVFDSAEGALAWAGQFLTTYEPVFVRLLASGVRVVVHFACDCAADYALFRVEARFFAPFVQAGIPIEFYTAVITPVAVAELESVRRSSSLLCSWRARLFPFASRASLFPFAPCRRFSSGSIASFVRPFPAAASVIPPPDGGVFPFPKLRSHAPNNALQRTALCALGFWLLFPSPSLSLDPLGCFASLAMIRWSETDLTEFFGVLGTFQDSGHAFEFSVSRDGLRLLFTLFVFEGAVYVSLYREGWPDPLFTVQREFCSHVQVVTTGERRYLEAGSPAHPVTNPGFAPVLARGVRIQVDPQFSIKLIDPSSYPAA